MRGRRVMLGACLLAAACARPRAPALPEDPAAALAWLPTDVRWVQHQGGGQVAMLAYLEAALRGRAPACLARHAGEVDHVFLLSRTVSDRSVAAVHGLVDRAAVEACALEVYQALTGQPATAERDGAFTRLRAGGQGLWLAWAGDGWAYVDARRERLAPLLARPAMPSLAAPLRPLLARVALRDGLWNVFAGDLTGPVLGVPSTGLVQRLASVPGPGQRPAHLPVTFTFASAEAAARARAAVEAAAADPRLAPVLRGALGAAGPRVRGPELEVEFGPFLAPAASEAGLAWLREGACRSGDAAACAPLAR